jgi:hypothetical protein
LEFGVGFQSKRDQQLGNPFRERTAICPERPSWMAMAWPSSDLYRLADSERNIVGGQLRHVREICSALGRT